MQIHGSLMIRNIFFGFRSHPKKTDFQKESFTEINLWKIEKFKRVVPGSARLGQPERGLD